MPIREKISWVEINKEFEIRNEGAGLLIVPRFETVARICELADYETEGQ
jgi:hypothetical protein